MVTTTIVSILNNAILLFWWSEWFTQSFTRSILYCRFEYGNRNMDPDI